MEATILYSHVGIKVSRSFTVSCSEIIYYCLCCCQVRMLHVDPRQRITLQQVLQHRWIMGRDQLPHHQLNLTEDSQKVKVSGGRG